jgi:hypothetical protein
MIKLINTKTNKEVNIGDEVTNFRGDKGVLTDVSPQTGMNGHIYMDGCQYYPSVIGCKFIVVGNETTSKESFLPVGCITNDGKLVTKLN